MIKFQAGKAELGLTVQSPRGTALPFDASSTPQGNHVTYDPREPGVHLVYLTYGGLNVPGLTDQLYLMVLIAIQV